jgi:PAS domain S-box-containing protein
LKTNTNILHFKASESNDQRIEKILLASVDAYDYVSIDPTNDLEMVSEMYNPDVILFDESYCAPYSKHVLSCIKTAFSQIPILIIKNAPKKINIRFLEASHENFIFTNDLSNLLFKIRQVILEHKNKAILDKKSTVESEERFKTLIENSHDAIVLIDEAGFPTYYGSNAKKITGFSHEETKGKSVFDFLHEDDLEQCQSFFKEVSEKPNTPLIGTFRMKHKNGSYVWVEGTLTNMLHQPSVKAYVVNYRDVTSQINAKELLEKSESNLKTIFNNTKSSYVFADTDFNVILFNPQAFTKYRKELGVEIKEGDNLLMYLPEEYRAISKNRFESVVANNKITYETSFHHESGDVAWYSVHMFPVNDNLNNVKGFVIESKEITKRKKIELERAKMSGEIASRNKDLEHFGHIISHSLRAPVANILGLANLIKTIPELTKEDMQRCVDGFHSSGKELDEVVMDLNLILQSRNGVHEQKEVVVLSELVKEIEQQFHDIIQRDGVQIRTKFDVDQICTIKSHLQVIFFNLISNSIKYHRPGVKQEILISSKEEYGKYSLKFRDNGIGIDLNKFKDKIFAPYKIFHPHRSGKGIGLYFAKIHADILDGDLKVESNVNSGTEFSLELNTCSV